MSYISHAGRVSLPTPWSQAPVYTDDLATLSIYANGKAHIRLLRYTHGGFWELKVFSSTEAPPYSALSYSWGVGSQVETGLKLRHTGSRLLITGGLEACLRHIRHRTSNWLWIDAICINQANPSEKNHQVSRMKLIYEGAHEVLVWLGEPEWPILDAATNVHAQQVPATWYGLPEDVSRVWHGFDPRQFESLLHHGNISWWNRLWILQEVVSSARVTVNIGLHAIPWDEFTQALRSLPDTLSSLSWDLDKRTSGLLQNAIHQMKQLYDLRKHLRSSPGGEEILDLIRLTSASHASNPRDKVYGLLGLATERDRQGVPISYADNVAKVFADFTKHIIRTKANADVLIDQWERSVGQTPLSVIDALPSWVPNFSRPPRKKPLSIARVKTYYASAGAVPRDWSVRDTALSVMAKIVDVVDAVMTDCVQESEPGEELDTLRLFTLPVIRAFVSYDRPFRMAANDFKKTLLRSNTLWRTLVLDNGSSPISPAPPAFETVFSTLEQSVSDDGIDDTETLLEKLGGHADMALEYVRQVTKVLRRRVIFTTRAQFVGVAAAHVRKGDVVVVAHGASTPWILRETEVSGRYSLVVDCYVEGIMYGEAMKCGLESEVVTLV